MKKNISTLLLLLLVAMTVQAQNALLKTLEEPPAYAVIMLLTSNPEALLPTIQSRCVVLNMKPVPDDIVKNYLMKELHIITILLVMN